MYRHKLKRGNTMEKKAGRPTENPKSVMVPVRMDAETLEILEKCKKISGNSGSEIIRRGIKYFYDISIIAEQNNADIDYCIMQMRQHMDAEIDPVQAALDNLEIAVKLIKKIKT